MDENNYFTESIHAKMITVCLVFYGSFRLPLDNSLVKKFVCSRSDIFVLMKYRTVFRGLNEEWVNLIVRFVYMVFTSS